MLQNCHVYKTFMAPFGRGSISSAICMQAGASNDIID